MENLMELLEKQDNDAWALVSTDLENKILTYPAHSDQKYNSQFRYALIDLDTRRSQGFSKELLNQMIIRAERSKMKLNRVFVSEKDLNTVRNDWSDSAETAIETEDIQIINVLLSSIRPLNLEPNFAFGIATNDKEDILVIVGVTGEALLQ